MFRDHLLDAPAHGSGNTLERGYRAAGVPDATGSRHTSPGHPADRDYGNTVFATLVRSRPRLAVCVGGGLAGIWFLAMARNSMPQFAG